MDRVVPLLRSYVLEQHGTRQLGASSDLWPQLDSDMVVYRGHTSGNPTIRRGNALYSASKSRNLAIDEFTHPTCCLFKIHLPKGTHYLDVNVWMGQNHAKADEVEIIFEGGGAFFQDASRTSTGVSEIGVYRGRRMFETYYKVGGASPLPRSPRSPRSPRTSPSRYLTADDLIFRFESDKNLYIEDSVMDGHAYIEDIRKQLQNGEKVSNNVANEFIRRMSGGRRRL